MKLDEEHKQFRDSVRAMVAGHVTPIADELDRTQRFPRELPGFGVGGESSHVERSRGGAIDCRVEGNGTR